MYICIHLPFSIHTHVFFWVGSLLVQIDGLFTLMVPGTIGSLHCPGTLVSLEGGLVGRELGGSNGNLWNLRGPPPNLILYV